MPFSRSLQKLLDSSQTVRALIYMSATKKYFLLQLSNVFCQINLQVEWLTALMQFFKKKCKIQVGFPHYKQVFWTRLKLNTTCKRNCPSCFSFLVAILKVRSISLNKLHLLGRTSCIAIVIQSKWNSFFFLLVWFRSIAFRMVPSLKLPMLQNYIKLII